MPAVSFLGSRCTGDGCFPPRNSLNGGASTVFVNGKPVLLAGAAWAVHGCGDDAHDGTSTGCSSTVFVEGHGVVRVGDDISCGSAVAEGSSTVFAGG